MTWTWFWICVHYDLDDMTFGQGHDTPLGHGQLCEILHFVSRSNLTERSYDPDFGYVCTVTLTLEI